MSTFFRDLQRDLLSGTYQHTAEGSTALRRLTTLDEAADIARAAEAEEVGA